MCRHPTRCLSAQTNDALQFEKTPKSSVVERKIRVNWLASDATEGSGAGEVNKQRLSLLPTLSN